MVCDPEKFEAGLRRWLQAWIQEIEDDEYKELGRTSVEMGIDRTEIRPNGRVTEGTKLINRLVRNGKWRAEHIVRFANRLGMPPWKFVKFIEDHWLDS